jgi:hypothetical protein
MSRLHQTLLKLLGWGWFCFVMAAMGFSVIWPLPQHVVLIDRSYCAPAQWQQVSQAYAELYRQHQSHQIQLKTVVVFSHLGQEVYDRPLPTIANLSTYGRPDVSRQSQLQTTYRDAQLLTCQTAAK